MPTPPLRGHACPRNGCRGHATPIVAVTQQQAKANGEDEGDMRRHDYEKEAALRERARLEPARTQVHTALAAWLVRTGRLAQACEVLRAALGLAERTGPIHHLLGLVLCGAGDYQSGLRYLKRAVAREPARFVFVRDLGLAEGAAGLAASSIETLRQAAALAGDEGAAPTWLLRVGERCVAASGGRAARQPPRVPRRAVVIERIVSRDPEVAEALIPRKGAPGSRQRETLRAARRALARLATDHPAHADVHFGLSLVAAQLGEIDRATEAAEKALTINPRYVEACLLAVRLYEKSGDPKRAEQRCRQAAQLKPRWPDVHVCLGRLLREQGRPGEAADEYRQALQIDANCREARLGIEVLATATAGEGGET